MSRGLRYPFTRRRSGGLGAKPFTSQAEDQGSILSGVEFGLMQAGQSTKLWLVQEPSSWKNITIGGYQ